MANVTSDMLTYNFILLSESEHIEIDYAPLDKIEPRFWFYSRLNKYRFPEDALMLSWGEFIHSHKYIRSFHSIGGFLGIIAGYDEVKILNLPVHYTYSLWHHYAKQYTEFLEVLETINAQAPSPKKIAKDMSEFGLTNITDFLSSAKGVSSKEIESMNCYELIAEYKREIYKDLNRRAQLKTNKND